MKDRTLTNTDIDVLITRFREIFYDKQESEEKMRQIVREEIKNETKHLPTREEFYEQTEKLYKRQNDLEEEQDMLSHRVTKHSDQIAKIEKQINLSPMD